MVLTERQLEIYSECMILEAGDFEENFKTALRRILKGEKNAKLEKELEELAAFNKMDKEALYKNKNKFWSVLRSFLRAFLSYTTAVRTVGGSLATVQAAGALGVVNPVLALSALLGGAIGILIGNLIDKLLRVCVDKAEMKENLKNINALISDLKKSKSKAEGKDVEKIDKFIKRLEDLKEKYEKSI